MPRRRFPRRTRHRIRTPARGRRQRPSAHGGPRLRTPVLRHLRRKAATTSTNRTTRAPTPMDRRRRPTARKRAPQVRTPHRSQSRDSRPPNENGPRERRCRRGHSGHLYLGSVETSRSHFVSRRVRWADARAGAAPDFVYWLTFLCSAFRYSNALSSPISCTSVASIVYDVPDEFGFATWISSLSFGLSRSDQHLSSPMPFFFACSV